MVVCKISMKKIALVLLCMTLAFICAQFLIIWYAADDDVDIWNDFDQSQISKVVREEMVQHDDGKFGIPARSDMMHQLQMMELGNVEYGYDFNVDRIERQIKNPHQYTLDHGLPIILWWTPFTGDMGSVKKCSEGNCFITQDRSFFGHQLNQVLIFYGTSFNESDLPLPRKTEHEWAVLHEESPKNVAFFYHEEFISLFNHTATFKQDSDYPITTQYVNSIEEVVKKPVLSFTEKDKLGLAPAIYLQSGCNPPSDRDAYVNELMKYMPVDSYGACLNNKKMPEHLQSPLTMHDDALREFVGKYKFALTFENAVCNDYITEKLWRPIAAGTVPIYKGAPNIRQWLPDNNSVILVDDFKNPKDLADYLIYLASHEGEYNKYLSFKKTGITNGKLLKRLRQRDWGVNDFSKMSFVTGFECFICDRVHKSRKILKERGERLKFVANKKHYGCPKPQTYNFASPPNTEDWERETWQMEYDEAKNQADKIRDMVIK